MISFFYLFFNFYLRVCFDCIFWEYIFSVLLEITFWKFIFFREHATYGCWRCCRQMSALNSNAFPYPPQVLSCRFLGEVGRARQEVVRRQNESSDGQNQSLGRHERRSGQGIRWSINGNTVKPHYRAPATKALPPIRHGLSKSQFFSLNSFVNEFRLYGMVWASPNFSLLIPLLMNSANKAFHNSTIINRICLDIH